MNSMRRHARCRTAFPVNHHYLRKASSTGDSPGFRTLNQKSRLISAPSRHARYGALPFRPRTPWNENGKTPSQALLPVTCGPSRTPRRVLYPVPFAPWNGKLKTPSQALLPITCSHSRTRRHDREMAPGLVCYDEKTPLITAVPSILSKIVEAKKRDLASR